MISRSEKRFAKLSLSFPLKMRSRQKLLAVLLPKLRTKLVLGSWPILRQSYLYLSRISVLTTPISLICNLLQSNLTLKEAILKPYLMPQIQNKHKIQFILFSQIISSKNPFEQLVFSLIGYITTNKQILLVVTQIIHDQYLLQSVKIEMNNELAQQIKQLFLQDDQESIRYIIAGQTQNNVKQLCALLPPEMAVSLKNMYDEVKVQDEEPEVEIQYQERNRRIDEHLEKEQLEQKRNSFLQLLSKENQKLIYQEHFGYPFYDLCKRIMVTHGDLKPLQPTIKTIHSQVQILYSTLFSQQVLEWLRENYSNLTQAFRELLCYVFPFECDKYFQFHKIYRKIKKETNQEKQQGEDELPLDEEQKEQEKKIMGVYDDKTLDLDQKEFLVSLSQSAEEFQQFEKNRSFNFLCFGLRKYQTYIGLGPTVFCHIKEREFCELLSFLSIRFIRKIIFHIIRQKGNGKLAQACTSISTQEIKRVGNEITDQISIKINEYLRPIRSVEDDAKIIFFEQFEPYSYKDFIPRKSVIEAQNGRQQLQQYVWKTCKDYKAIWSQRVKVQRYMKNGGVRPQNDFIKYYEENKDRYKQNVPKAWKDYIMAKFGFETEQKIVIPKKRMKLQSLND